MQIHTNQQQKELKNHGEYTFPLLVSYEQLSRYESGSFLWHWHPELELTLITKGELIYNVNQLSFHLVEGDALIGNANTLHSGHMYDNKDCQYIPITFDPKLIYGFEHSAIFQKYVEPLLKNDALPAIQLKPSVSWQKEMIQNIRDIIRIYEQKDTYYELDITILLQSFWHTLLMNQKDILLHTRQSPLEYDRIKHIMAYLDDNYMHKISLAEIANAIHLCPSECSRLFKRCMHISLFSFLQEYRVEKSLQYLTNTTYSITDIASLVGFSDSNYYSKVFVRVKGCSPKNYRKNKSLNLTDTKKS